MTSSQKNSLKTRKFLVTSLAAASLLGSLGGLPVAQAAPEQAPASSSQQTCSYRSFAVQAQQIQGLPGQYQLAYSASNDALWVTASNGRPPIMTSTLAKVDPATMQITHTVGLNTAPYSPRGWEGAEPAGTQVAGAYGVGVDEANGTVWVTNTRVNAVTAFDQKTMKKVFSSLDLPEDKQISIPHPREVRSVGGKVFVGTQGSVLVFDGASFELIKTIPITDPAGRASSVMNFALDEQKQLGYFPVFGSNELTVIDLQTLEIKRDVSFQLQGNDPQARLVPSDVTFDNSLGEVYVSSQGQDGKNAGVGVYDQATGAFKRWIDFGTQALSLDADEEKDLIYATDFKTGAYYVIDGRTHNIASTVERTLGQGMGANDVLVTKHGVFGVGRSSAFENVEVPFTLDYKTGQYKTSSLEVKGLVNTAAEGQSPQWIEADPSPINAQVLTRFKVDEKGMVTGQMQASDQLINSFEAQSKDGAKLVVENVSEGGMMTLKGTGFKHPQGGGSVLGLLYDDRATQMKDAEGGIVRSIEADAEGNFSLTLPVPTADNSNNAWVAGSEHRIRVLTGSLKEGDTARSLPLQVNVAPAAQLDCQAPAAGTVSPSLLNFAGYGTFVDSSQGLLEQPAPEASPQPSQPAPEQPQPSQSASPQPSQPVAPSAEPSQSAQPSESAQPQVPAPSSQPSESAQAPAPVVSGASDQQQKAGESAQASQKQSQAAQGQKSTQQAGQQGSQQASGQQQNQGVLAKTGASSLLLIAGLGLGALLLGAGLMARKGRPEA